MKKLLNIFRSGIIHLIPIILVVILLFFIFYGNKKKIENYNNMDLVEYHKIPVIVICWNNLSFIKKFVEQMSKYPNPIILLDNNSNFPPIFDYYKKILEELPNKVQVILLEENYGHEVYIKLKERLPDLYILSDPDLQINPKMPQKFAEIMVNISEKYNSYKVGASLDISDSENFIHCDNYTKNKSIYEWESQFWKKLIPDDNYKLYDADIDTTFCLVNTKYKEKNVSIRIAGDFTMKHLPWYKDYIKNNTPKDELEHWKKNNKSSSILWTCLKL